MIQEQYYKWHSQYISRDFEMLVFGHDGFPVILFPTSKGKYYQNKDFKLLDSVHHFLEEGRVKIYCPDSMDAESWYNYGIHPADRVKTHIAYENLILHDVIPFAQYETGQKKVAVAGCSFGGYHAANLAFRHPANVAYMFSLGGAFDIKQFIMGYYDDNSYYNNPPDYLSGLQDNWYLSQLREMGIVLGTGEWDICLDENKRLSGLLHNLGVQHWLDIRSETGHDWQWWHQMLPQYLSQIK